MKNLILTFIVLLIPVYVYAIDYKIEINKITDYKDHYAVCFEVFTNDINSNLVVYNCVPIVKNKEIKSIDPITNNEIVELIPKTKTEIKQEFDNLVKDAINNKLQNDNMINELKGVITLP